MRLVLVLPVREAFKRSRFITMWRAMVTVVGGEACAHARRILVELDLQTPVHGILDFPMAAHRTGNPRGLGGQRTDVVAPLAGGLCADRALALDDRETPERRPLFGLVEPGELSEGPAASHFPAPMRILAVLARGTGRQGASHADRADRAEQEGFEELGVVILHTQHVVGAPLANGLRNAGLGAHRIERDDTALKGQRRQQFCDGGDLIELCGRRRPPQYQADVGGKRADQMQGAGRRFGRAAPTGAPTSPIRNARFIKSGRGNPMSRYSRSRWRRAGCS